METYDKVLALIPEDERLIVIRAGINITKGDALLLMGNGPGALDAAEQANHWLDQFTDQEKRSAAWTAMMAQTMTVAAAGMLYVKLRNGDNFEAELERLESVSTVAGIPEIHFFLGIGYAALGESARAKSEFESYLSAPEETVGFLAKDYMTGMAEIRAAELE